MRRVVPCLLALSLTVPTFAQGGDMLQRDQAAARAIDREISTYLDGPQNPVILTPGNTASWPLKLGAGEVVVAEASSEAFDPALEIADANGNAIAVNDDRYTGDQRPLLFWRCPEAGTYSLRLRCFDDKAGGRAYVRFRTYETMDLATGKPADKALDSARRFLVRMPMKAGQIEQVVFDTPDGSYARPVLRQAISPIGLPDANLTSKLDSVLFGTVMASVDGDYYVVAECGDNKAKVRGYAREFKPAALAREAGRCSVKAPTNVASLWLLPVKKGELLEISAPDLRQDARLIFAEVPDISRFDLSKPDSNPFTPQQAGHTPDQGPAWTGMPARTGDPRCDVFLVERDTNLWVATDGAGAQGGQFALNVRPAATEFVTGSAVKGNLQIARTDHWAFDVKAGDVMAFSIAAKSFAWKVDITGLDLGDAGHFEAGLDQAEHAWNMVLQRPGRYVLSVSAKGDGGGGEYALTRRVFHASEFGKGRPAKGVLEDGKTQVWKFAVKPSEPLYMHWKSSRPWAAQGPFTALAYQENGELTGLSLTRVGELEDFGIMTVTQPMTYLLVLSCNGPKVEYSIDLTDLPGYVKGK